MRRVLLAALAAVALVLMVFLGVNALTVRDEAAVTVPVEPIVGTPDPTLAPVDPMPTDPAPVDPAPEPIPPAPPQDIDDDDDDDDNDDD